MCVVTGTCRCEFGGIFLVKFEQLCSLLFVEIIQRYHVVGLLLNHIGWRLAVFVALVTVLCKSHRGRNKSHDEKDKMFFHVFYGINNNSLSANLTL